MARPTDEERLRLPLKRARKLRLANPHPVVLPSGQVLERALVIALGEVKPSTIKRRRALLLPVV